MICFYFWEASLTLGALIGAGLGYGPIRSLLTDTDADRAALTAAQAQAERDRQALADAQAVIAWGACASWGCVQAAKPNPTQATPIDKVITDKPIIKVPGCPPIAEVMTGVVTYILTFGRLPELDRQGRPKMFYSQRVHDKCYRRGH